MKPPKENPGALAGATGAKEDKKATNFQLQEYRATCPLATHFHDVKSGSIEPLCLLGEAFNG